MATLLETIQHQLTPRLIDGAAAQLGENPSAISKAIGALAPTILAGMAGKASDDQALGRMHASLGEAASRGFLDQLGDLVGTGNLARNDPKDIAGAFIGALFGDKIGGILKAVTSFAGLKTGSASSLLGLAGPLVMGALGKRMKDDGVDAMGLRRLLLDEKSTIGKALPPEIAGIIGFGGVEPPRVATARVDHAPAAATIAATTAAAATRRATPAWAWAIPVVLGVSLIGWLMSRGGADKVAQTTPAAVETAAVAEPVVNEPASVEPATSYSITPAEPVTEFVRDLGGFQLRGAANGVESRLLAFIDSNRAPCTEADCWYSFDRLTFKTGSAQLDMEKSADQIENIRRILEAYPTVQLKIGGYTDSTGAPEANMQLSQARADAVVAALTALGVAPGRLVAEGYGAQFPVASNDTEEGRAMNRRIDVRVRER
jgi:outer membrane protein OmpA-like peptidoglycan-associated protein